MDHNQIAVEMNKSSEEIEIKDQINIYTSPGERFEKQAKLFSLKSSNVFQGLEIESGMNVSWTSFELKDMEDAEIQNVKS